MTTVLTEERQTRMSAHGSTAARKLLEKELAPPIASLVRQIETERKKPFREVRLETVDVAPVVGYVDDDGTPVLAVSKGASPTEVDVVLEIARVLHRRGRVEKYMPYAEMRHEANRRLCRRLYRVIEEEVLLADVESYGYPARKTLLDRLSERFREPLGRGVYRQGEAEPGRLREGALDALEMAIAETDATTARRFMGEIAELDAGIARPFGLMYKVVENHRPFEADDRVRAAYYLAVPFLFDARKPSQPVFRTRPQ